MIVLGIKWGWNPPMLTCLSVTRKAWRDSLRFRCQHFIYLYVTKNFLNFFVTYVPTHIYDPLTTYVLLKHNQTQENNSKLCCPIVEKNNFPPSLFSDYKSLIKYWKYWKVIYMVKNFKHGWKNDVVVNMVTLFVEGVFRRLSFSGNLKPSDTTLGLQNTPTWDFF